MMLSNDILKQKRFTFVQAWAYCQTKMHAHTNTYIPIHIYQNKNKFDDC